MLCDPEGGSPLFFPRFYLHEYSEFFHLSPGFDRDVPPSSFRSPFPSSITYSQSVFFAAIFLRMLHVPVFFLDLAVTFFFFFVSPFPVVSSSAVYKDRFPFPHPNDNPLLRVPFADAGRSPSRSWTTVRPLSLYQLGWAFYLSQASLWFLLGSDALGSIVPPQSLSCCFLLSSPSIALLATPPLIPPLPPSVCVSPFP